MAMRSTCWQTSVLCCAETRPRADPDAAAALNAGMEDLDVSPEGKLPSEGSSQRLGWSSLPLDQGPQLWEQQQQVQQQPQLEPGADARLRQHPHHHHHHHQQQQQQQQQKQKQKQQQKQQRSRGNPSRGGAANILHLLENMGHGIDDSDDDDHQEQPGAAAGDEAEVLLLGGGGAAAEEGAAAGCNEEPQEFAEADFHLSRSDVLQRIEQLVSDLITTIIQGQLPVLSLVSRGSKNVHLVADAEAAFLEELYGSQAPAAKRLKLGSRVQVKSLTAGQGTQANSIVRIFRVLEAVHALLRSGKQATQRDLYYKLSGPPFFNKADDVNRVIQDVVALLRVPRSSLGITCASKGAVAGKLLIKDHPAAAWQDCSLLPGSAGRAIPGEVGAIQQMSFRVSARYILVVEKDAIFQRLVEDRLPESLPCVLVTAKGMPDLATRAFLHHLTTQAPGLPVLGLVDWNPAGVAILLSYKFGNHTMGLEAGRYALPGLRWLGVVANMLEEVPDAVLQPLTPRDKAMLPRLKERLEGHEEWQQEVCEMEDSGCKADIEALYSTLGYEGLQALVSRCIMQRQYI